MKWFHHDCSAKHDPALQVLGSRHGAAGLGVYWGLLEELGEHSDTFQLKITELPAGSARGGSLRPQGSAALLDVPKFPAGLLARILFVTKERLLAVIESAVAEGLFDADKWTNEAILYSPQFENRADNYTRRQRRIAESLRTHSEPSGESLRTHSEPSAEPVRTNSEPSAKSVRTNSEPSAKSVRANSEPSAKNVPLEQNRREKEKNRTDKSAEVIDISTASVEISTLKLEIHEKIVRWDEEHPGSIHWVPTDEDVGALLRGVGCNGQIDLCREATALTGKNVSFRSLALRAVDLMLRAAVKNRVTNPAGYIRMSLFGNGDGKPPWVLKDLLRNPAGAVQ